MDKIHIRNMFRVLLPLADSLGIPQITAPNLQSQSSNKQTDSFGVEFSTLKQIKVRLFCTDHFGNVKEEVKDCFSWAKRNAVMYKKDDNDNVEGILLRLKISQGVFDFRKSRRRMFRITVELHENGSVTRTGASAIMPLYPKKRHSNLQSEGNEAVVPICWFGEDGYLIDNKPDETSPEDNSSPLSADNSEPYLSVNTTHNSHQLMESPECDSSQSIHVHEIGDAIFGESLPESNQFLMVSDRMDYHTSHNHNYMVLYNGNAEVVGNFRALNFYKASDINLKEDIRLLEDDHDCRATLLKINGVEYKFKQGVSHATNKRFIGYIAQQIESVVPEAVQLIDGILHVDYESLIPYLSESIKQNYGDIQSVTSEVDRVKQALDALYVKFTATNKQPEKKAEDQKQRVTARGAFGWIASVVAVSALLTFTFVFLFVAGQQPHYRPTLEHLVPAANTVNTITSEREMLMELYEYLRPEESKPIWNFTESHCSWRGITCNSKTGRVIAINLPEFAYVIRKVSIPASLGNFTDLQELDLSGNFINAKFPQQIARLTNLVSLRLNDNILFGVIPDLRGLSKLKTLWLQPSQVEGSLDTLLMLPALESIIIEGLMHGSVLPEKISPSLLELEIANSGIKGTIPESWTGSNLVRIDLGLNALIGSVPCFGPHVINFTVNFNRLDGQFCGESLQAIKVLAINNNKLTGPFDLPNVDVGNMTMLQVSTNHFTSFLPSTKDALSGLGPLYCSASNNAFKCPVPEWSARCSVSCN